jgi:hypothetical protein
MRWSSDRRGRLEDAAERLTGRGLLWLVEESAALSDRETVRQ